MMAAAGDDDGPSCPWPQRPFHQLQDQIALARKNATIGLRWYLAHCYARSEARARDQMKAIGYDVYAPQLMRMKPPPRDRLSAKQRRMIGTLRRPSVEALFPQYVFLQMNLRTDPWRDVFRIVGVSGVACEGDAPWPVPAGFVEGIQAREQGGALPHDVLVRDLMAALCGKAHMAQEQGPPAAKSRPFPYSRGEVVRINDGPFSGFCGAVSAIPAEVVIGDLDESARVTVFADLFGRSVPVELEVGQIEKH
jgi:transcription antitermination factor NusG